MTDCSFYSSSSFAFCCVHRTKCCNQSVCKEQQQHLVLHLSRHWGGGGWLTASLNQWRTPNKAIKSSCDLPSGCILPLFFFFLLQRMDCGKYKNVHLHPVPVPCALESNIKKTFWFYMQPSSSLGCRLVLLLVGDWLLGSILFFFCRVLSTCLFRIKFNRSPTTCNKKGHKTLRTVPSFSPWVSQSVSHSVCSGTQCLAWEINNRFPHIIKH